MAAPRDANNRVLIVDDQQEIHSDFADMLLQPEIESKADAEYAAAFLGSDTGERPLPRFELLHARSGLEACSVIRSTREAGRPVAVAFVDIRMPPGMDGIETVRRVREFDRDVEIVIMTACADRSLSNSVRSLDLPHKLLYVRKPFIREEIQQMTLSLVGKWNVEQALAGSHRRLKAVLDAAGDAMAMFDSTGRVVLANQPFERVLDLGEHELRQTAPEALAARIRKRFRKPMMNGDAGIAGAIVETVGPGQVPEKQLLFLRSTAAVGSGDEAGSRLVVYRDVSREIEAERMRAEVLRLRSELNTAVSFAGLVGNGPSMRRMYALMRQAVDSDITVLVRGESGTGKELVARSLHEHSQRKDGPFVAVDCAAIPEPLIESELFGHERGAFTGAQERRVGAFERAHGGTLLLDEIGEMPLPLQSRLLRVLQERQVQRLGGDTKPVDIRVVAATNKDLEAAVAAGEFRVDLFYRLAAFPIALPSLRERREDIPLLARHLLDRYAAAAEKRIGGISASALDLLRQYDWPGNVRELENAIYRAVLLEQGTALQAGSLPPEVARRGAAPDASLAGTLAQAERQALSHAIEVTGGCMPAAAQALGIDRSTLHRKLKRHDLLS